jgi:NitT/TauT family transport system substrate-binding protein
MHSSRATYILFVAATVCLTWSSPALAEAARVRIAQQFGISYLPLTVVKERDLLSQRLTKAGLKTTVEWIVLSGAGPMNDALISGSLDFASAGAGPMILTWDKTRGSANIIGVAALGSMPNVLMTNRAEVKSLRDFTSKDRIAMPAVKVGFQPIVLQMAADKEFGRYDHLDHLTVAMPHPDAAAALISGKLEISAHFTSPPFVQQIEQSGKAHAVLNSYDVVGGPHTFNVVYGPQKFITDNPIILSAFVDALDEANAWIVANPRDAAVLYINAEKSKLAPDLIESIIKDPKNTFTISPENTKAFADFLSRVGLIKAKPTNWKDYFFAGLHNRTGS